MEEAASAWAASERAWQPRASVEASANDATRRRRDPFVGVAVAAVRRANNAALPSYRNRNMNVPMASVVVVCSSRPGHRRISIVTPARRTNLARQQIFQVVVARASTAQSPSRYGRRPRYHSCGPRLTVSVAIECACGRRWREPNITAGTPARRNRPARPTQRVSSRGP